MKKVCFMVMIVCLLISASTVFSIVTVTSTPGEVVDDPNFVPQGIQGPVSVISTPGEVVNDPGFVPQEIQGPVSVISTPGEVVNDPNFVPQMADDAVPSTSSVIVTETTGETKEETITEEKGIVASLFSFLFSEKKTTSVSTEEASELNAETEAPIDNISKQSGSFIERILRFFR